MIKCYKSVRNSSYLPRFQLCILLASVHDSFLRTSKRSWCVETTEFDVNRYINRRMRSVKLFIIMAMKGFWSIIGALDVIIRVCGPHIRWKSWFFFAQVNPLKWLFFFRSNVGSTRSNVVHRFDYTSPKRDSNSQR
jgi:hypothetical protein